MILKAPSALFCPLISVNSSFLKAFKSVTQALKRHQKTLMGKATDLHEADGWREMLVRQGGENYKEAYLYTVQV